MKKALLLLIATFALAPVASVATAENSCAAGERGRVDHLDRLQARERHGSPR